MTGATAGKAPKPETTAMSPKTKSASPVPQLAAAWRAALHGTFAAALAHLSETQANDAIVHAARRELKRLAALTRLAPSHLRDLARDTRRAADVARRALGEKRNAAVMSKLIDHAAEKLGERAQAVRDAIAQTDADAAPAADHRAALEAVRDSWRAAEIAPDADLLTPVVKTYRRARRRMKRARDGSTAALHRWRSSIVAHHYQMTFLAKLAPALKAQAKEIDALRDRLGDWNDIDMLQTHAHDGLDKAGRRALDAALVDDKTRLETSATKSGAAIFDPRPKFFRARLTEALEEALREKRDEKA